MVPAPEALGGSEGVIPRVFPRGILSLEMIFLCQHCDCHIQIDARGEGHAVNCPRCTQETVVPRWSGHEPGEVTLSDAEVEFLTAAIQNDGHR